MKKKIFIIFLLFINLFLLVIGILYENIRKNVEEGFYLNGEDTIVLQYGEQYEEAGFIANIRNKSHINDVIVSSNINVNKLGSYEITYTLSYLNYSKTLKRDVKIIDTTSPTLTVDCDLNQYIVVNDKIDNCKITADDNYDKDLTDKIVVDSNVNNKKVGDYEIKYSVSDSSHNKTEKTLQVHVRNKFDIYYVNVSISKQKLEYFQKNKLVLSTPITSGAHNATKTGTFKIRNKVRNTTLKGEDYVSFVKYWMGYGGAYGLHDASWRSKFGTMDYKTKGSHGCINMPTSAAKKLYDMIEIGTPVYIKN